MADSGQVFQCLTRMIIGQFGPDTRVGEPHLIKEGGRNRVYRIPLSGTACGTRSVIAKCLINGEALFYTDWASLAFLGESMGVETTPRPYALSLEPPCFLMQDLGGGRTLNHCLEGQDQAAVIEYCRKMASRMAELIGGSIGREQDYLSLREPLPGRPYPERHEEAARWREGLSKVRDWAVALAVPEQAGLEAAWKRIADAYAEPGPLLTFSHGDPAPENNHMNDVGVVRLLDFEYGAFRHVLYDLSAWGMLCPLPESWLEPMCRIFREKVAESLPQLADDTIFQQEWALMCGYRGCAMLSWFPTKILEQNQAWVDAWTTREAMLSTLTRITRFCAAAKALDPLTKLVASMDDVLHKRWPELGEGSIKWPVLATIGTNIPG